MRAFLMGIAAVLAVALPSAAFAETGGHLKLTYASIDDDRSNNDECECYYYGQSSDNVIALSGAVVTDVTDQWRVQFNATSADTASEYYNTSYSDAHSQAEVHATYATGMFDVGVFTGMFNNNGYNFYEYGAEAAANFERGEVALSVAGASSPNTDRLGDIQTVAASGVFNLTEDVSVGATVSTTTFDGWYSNDDVDVDSLGVHVAYQIPNSNFTVGLGYRHAEVDFGNDYYFGSGDRETDFVGVSAAWSFGSGAAGREMPGASALIPDAIAAMSSFLS